MNAGSTYNLLVISAGGGGAILWTRPPNNRYTLYMYNTQWCSQDLEVGAQEVPQKLKPFAHLDITFWCQALQFYSTIFNMIKQKIWLLTSIDYSQCLSRHKYANLQVLHYFLLTHSVCTTTVLLCNCISPFLQFCNWNGPFNQFL